MLLFVSSSLLRRSRRLLWRFEKERERGEREERERESGRKSCRLGGRINDPSPEKEEKEEEEEKNDDSLLSLRKKEGRKETEDVRASAVKV